MSVFVVNASDRGSPRVLAYLAERAPQDVEDVLAHCDAMEQQGRGTVSIEWLRARLSHHRDFR